MAPARKKAQETLVLNEEQFRRAIEESPIPTIMQAEDGQVLQISRSWTELTGYSINHIRSFDEWITKAVYGEGASQVRDHLHKLFEGKKSSIGIEFIVRTLKGDSRYWSFSASSPGQLRDGRRFIVGMAVDITEQIKIREELKKLTEELEERVVQRTKEISSERQRLYNVLETLPSYVILLDRDYHVAFANKVFRETFGEHHGRRCYEYLFGKEHECENCETYKVYKENEPQHWYWTGPNDHDYDIYDFPFREADGSMLILEMGIDITEQRKAQKQLKDSERLAAIGSTAAMIGHDIRNPLQAITGDVYLLKDYLSTIPDTTTKNDVAESLEEIEKNVGYINKIIADLQDYSRTITLELRKINLYSLVIDAFRTIEIPQNVSPSIEIDSKINLKTDNTLLTRILSNLIINAIQAMPKGGKLTILAIKKQGRLVLSVDDTGIGIPEHVKPKLFTPMMTTKAKGQGLGLAVVKRMTEALGGTVTFESEEGKGTKFTIELPISIARRKPM